MSAPTPAQSPVIRPTARFMLSHPAHWLAQGFGSGLSPVMPGTAGTLFGWLIFHVLSQRWPEVFTTQHWLWAIVIGFPVGVWACRVTGNHLGAADHGSMVWDEVIAFWLILTVLTPTDFTTECWAFFWFRVFDMSKPAPIRAFERRFKGGFGVMTDDLLAAFYTLLLFALWRVGSH